MPCDFGGVYVRGTQPAHSGSGKALSEVLAVADNISLPMAGPRVNHKLSRHGPVRPPLQRDNNRIWSRLPRHGCHVALMWTNSGPKTMPSDHTTALSSGIHAMSSPQNEPVAELGHTPTLSSGIGAPLNPFWICSRRPAAPRRFPEESVPRQLATP